MTTTVTQPQADLSPTQLAEAITGRPYLSWSQINSFRSCPRAFTFKYVEGAEPAFVSSNLLFGSAIHTAIQAHFEQMIQGRTLPLDDLVEAFRLAWQQRQSEQPDVPVRFGNNEDLQSLTEAARNLLRCFLGSPLAQPAGHVVAIEEKLTGSLAGDLPAMLAIVDLIWQDTDGTHLVDFKTSRSKWGEAKVNESSAQLQLYKALAGDLADSQIHLHFGVLVKTKSPSTQFLDSPSAGADVEPLAKVVRPVWRAMQLGVDYANPSALGCSGCPYRDRCSAVSAM